MIKSQTLEAVWDMIPTLAVQVLAAKHDLSTMSYPDMLNELNNIMGDLFAAADHRFKIGTLFHVPFSPLPTPQS